MFQMARRDPTGTNEKVWLSPDRDIATMAPAWLTRAMSSAAHEMGFVRGSKDPLAPGQAEFKDFWLRVSAFVETCVGPDSGKTLDEHAARHGLGVPGDKEAERVLGRCLLRVILAEYYKGVRMSLHQGERQVGADQLRAAAVDIVGDRQ